MKVIAWLEFELAYYDVAIQHIATAHLAQSAGAEEYTDCIAAEG